jgi:hypothetical protein
MVLDNTSRVMLAADYTKLSDRPEWAAAKNNQVRLIMVEGPRPRLADMVEKIMYQCKDNICYGTLANPEVPIILPIMQTFATLDYTFKNEDFILELSVTCHCSEPGIMIEQPEPNWSCNKCNKHLSELALLPCQRSLKEFNSNGYLVKIDISCHRCIMSDARRLLEEIAAMVRMAQY